MNKLTDLIMIVALLFSLGATAAVLNETGQTRSLVITMINN
jgi:hypothetical protein